MRNPLQDQLLKAGLVNKAKVNQVVREQTRQREGKAPMPAPDTAVDAQRLQAERAERDRALAAEHNAKLRSAELRAQVRQIIHAARLPRDGEIDYRFTDGGLIRSVRVNEALRSQLASGAMVIARFEQSYEIIPRAAAEKVCERDPAAIVLDHGRTEAAHDVGEDDAYYRQFKVPDDLIW